MVTVRLAATKENGNAMILLLTRCLTNLLLKYSHDVSACAPSISSGPFYRLVANAYRARTAETLLVLVGNNPSVTESILVNRYSKHVQHARRWHNSKRFSVSCELRLDDGCIYAGISRRS